MDYKRNMGLSPKVTQRSLDEHDYRERVEYDRSAWVIDIGVIQELIDATHNLAIVKLIQSTSDNLLNLGSPIPCLEPANVIALKYGKIKVGMKCIVLYRNNMPLL